MVRGRGHGALFGPQHGYRYVKFRSDPFAMKRRLITPLAGPGTLEEALGWVEYCNGDEDTYFANMRRENGRDKPYGVSLVCLCDQPPLNLLIRIHLCLR